MRTITLLSDFGAASPYPAQMRGVLRERCRAALVDLTHDIPAHDIASGAVALAAAAPVFPAGTIHLAVVDPGVGTTRQGLVVAAGGHVFVGPDNGLLMRAARALGRPRAYAIDAARFARPSASATFHGRDLFAPAAAALAWGLRAERIGPPAAPPVELADEPAVRRGATLHGRVIYIDAFGNAVTNVPGVWLETVPDQLTLVTTQGPMAIRRVRTYGDAPAGLPIVLVGSDGTVEIAANAGRAADLLRLRVGDVVDIHRMPGTPRGRREEE